MALLPRLYSANLVGVGWYGPESFTPINFDEANACRAWLGANEYYSPVMGAQSVTLASVVGHPPPGGALGDPGLAKAYCMDAGHMLPARSLSAFMGAATVVVIALIALVLAPTRPALAWSSGLLLALSGFHATQSHMATVDAALTFYTYLFLLLVMLAQKRDSAGLLVVSGLAALVAITAKKVWPFPLLAYALLVPSRVWVWLKGDLNQRDLWVLAAATLVAPTLAFNTGFQQQGLLPLLFIFYLAVPWRRINPKIAPLFILYPALLWGITLIDTPMVREFTTGSMTSRFGSGFGAIGWSKLDRNLINLPIVLIVGIGLPAAMLIPLGLKAVLGEAPRSRLWLCFLPVVAWALYMLFIAPRTTYRHYLPLFPLACLLAAYGLHCLRASRNRLFLLVFFLWPALLQLDFQLDFHHDTRKQAIDWYRDNEGAKIFSTFYAAPPPGLNPPYRLFREEYAMGDAGPLRQADFLVLSENWYETAERQELNGVRVRHLDRLIKTTPERALLYRQVLAGEHPHLTLEREYIVQNFMPELVLHKLFYGTFQKFLGDIKIYRVTP